MYILNARTGWLVFSLASSLATRRGEGLKRGLFLFLAFCGSLFRFPSEDESPAIVEDGEGHEREQEDHAQHLGAFHEFLARLAPRGNFVEEEEHVAAIEGGDGEDVDEGEHEGDEGR